MEQYDQLIGALLSSSGGRFRVLPVIAALAAIKERFGLNWTIVQRGASITVTDNGRVLLAAEVVGRKVDRSRLIATFNTKIAPMAMDDYVFFFTVRGPTAEAREQARRYFGQGHDVNFLEIKNWILMMLATLGQKGRAAFDDELLKLLDAPEIPKSMKVAWNEQIAAIAGSLLAEPSQ